MVSKTARMSSGVQDGKSEWWCHGPGVAGEETVAGVSGWPWQRVGGRSVLWWVGRPGPAVAHTGPASSTVTVTATPQCSHKHVAS